MLVQPTHARQLIQLCTGAGEAGGFKEGEAAHWAAVGCSWQHLWPHQAGFGCSRFSSHRGAASWSRWWCGAAV